jgi:hypothetical protein
MAVLYDGTWETDIVTIPNAKIVAAVGYDKLNELGRQEIYDADKHRHCVGAYLFNELIELGLEGQAEVENEIQGRIWDILSTVNSNFSEEMTELLGEDFDKLLLELAQGATE